MVITPAKSQVAGAVASSAGITPAARHKHSLLVCQEILEIILVVAHLFTDFLQNPSLPWKACRRCYGGMK